MSDVFPSTIAEIDCAQERAKSSQAPLAPAPALKRRQEMARLPAREEILH
ncbi:hypothetical protein ACWDR1_06960 [Streptosporangium sandarakinum]